MPCSDRAKRKRANVVQQLGFVAAVESALHLVASDAAPDVLIWEDDCFMCDGTFMHLSDAANALRRLPVGDTWGSLKVGNGGSGVLLNANQIGSLINYLKLHRGSENVDVAMWRFVASKGLTDYISKRTYSAHRGERTSFKQLHSTVGLWKRVQCGNELDYYWGDYTACLDAELTEWKCNTAYKP